MTVLTIALTQCFSASPEAAFHEVFCSAFRGQGQKWQEANGAVTALSTCNDNGFCPPFSLGVDAQLILAKLKPLSSPSSFYFPAALDRRMRE